MHFCMRQYFWRNCFEAGARNYRPCFAKTSQNARFLLSENERFGLVFVKTGSINSGTVPEITDPVFAKTSQNAHFLLSEYERFGLVFTKTRVYKFGHRSRRERVGLSGLINGRNQFNSWGFSQVPHSGPGLCRTTSMGVCLQHAVYRRKAAGELVAMVGMTPYSLFLKVPWFNNRLASSDFSFSFR